MSDNKFPSWRYHRTERAVIVANQAESDALGPGWQDSPVFEPVEESVALSTDPEVDNELEALYETEEATPKKTKKSGR